jgi:hypothetical protein
MCTGAGEVAKVRFSWLVGGCERAVNAKGGLCGLVCVVRVAFIVQNVLDKVDGCEDVHRGVVLVCRVWFALESSVCNFSDKCTTWLLISSMNLCGM